MIVGYLREPKLVAALEAAALPEEDVFFGQGLGREALYRGFPRLLVLETSGSGASAPVDSVPVLAVTTRRALTPHPGAELLIPGVDDLPRAMAALVRAAVPGRTWVDDLFRDMTRLGGVALPAAFRGFCRRILEYPSHYADLHGMSSFTGYSRGALKARFRRQGLRSPAEHLRWLRVLATAHVLADPGVTTVQAAYLLGFTSSGNLCRAVQSTAGLSAGALREPPGRSELVVRFTDRFMAARDLGRWSRFEEIFLRKATAA